MQGEFQFLVFSRVDLVAEQPVDPASFTTSGALYGFSEHSFDLLTEE